MYKTHAAARKWEILLKSLKNGQREMLDLKPDSAGIIFDEAFGVMTKLCHEGIESLGIAERNTADFLLSSQLKLIQKTARPLYQTIEKLPQLSEREILILFEKQVRLTKIIRKHIDTLDNTLSL